MSSISAISLFSGGGGLDLGLEAVGVNTLVATDIDEHSCITLAKGKAEAAHRALPLLSHAEVLRADVLELSGAALMKKAGLRKGELDLLVGGPPCQAFSVFGQRRGRQDPRGQLVYHYIRLVTELRPAAFLFENVYGLLTVEGGHVFKEVCARLAEPEPGLRYALSIFRLNAVDFGVPQFRDRVFIFGSRTEQRISSPLAICSGNAADEPGKVRRRTVRDALAGMPKIDDPSLANHTGRKHSDRIIDRYANMGPGERDSHTRINRLDLDRPSFTIIVGSDKGGGKGHIHPIEPREVTPRESARVQTFPDWWAFSGTSRHPIRQVGNAVPPLLGAAIGRTIIEEAFKGSARSFDDVLRILGQQHLFSKKEVLSIMRAQSDRHAHRPQDLLADLPLAV